MKDMDAASKLFITHPKVSRDTVNFVLQGSGYMKKDVSVYDQYVLGLGKEEGKNIGITQTVQKYIWNRWKKHVTKVQILKDLESYFKMDEKEARRYMDEALAKV